MHPDIFRIGSLTLHAYGAMLTLSFILGLLLALRRSGRRGVAREHVMDLFQIIILAAIVGARIFFVVFHLDLYRDRWWRVLALWEGGLTLYGGLLLAIGASWLYLRLRRVPFLVMADVMAPSLGLGIMVTRVGCFLNGCCFGLPTDCPLGVGFPPGSEATETARTLLAHDRGRSLLDLPLSPAIHPAQLYASLGGALILAILLLLDRRPRRPGFLFAGFLVLYGIHRFVVDQFRYYEEAMRVLGLSVNQWLSVGLVVAGLFLFAWIRRRRQLAA
ncbi:MAG: prolipoprotein diacylglyceryl transferase [Candidatus Krumholzibacteriota bacterium]|nr:prolipoprotein diacylglyceryl transferase [Candidatus Krumholzibacteriota bacterium]